MSEVVIESVNEYDILLNEDEEVLVAIRARLGGVNKPQVLYDGKNDKILLYRNADQLICLVDVPKPICEALQKISKLLMVEVHDESIVREYMVPLKKVSRLPTIASYK